MLNDVTIGNDERFSDLRFPAAAKEVEDLLYALVKTRDLYRTEIVISFLRYHSVKSEWLKGNGKVVETLRSSSTAIVNLESLFSSSRNNPLFTADLEAYIGRKLSASNAQVHTSDYSF
jgi:hypothetical protein